MHAFPAVQVALWGRRVEARIFASGCREDEGSRPSPDWRSLYWRWVDVRQCESNMLIHPSNEVIHHLVTVYLGDWIADQWCLKLGKKGRLTGRNCDATTDSLCIRLWSESQYDLCLIWTILILILSQHERQIQTPNLASTYLVMIDDLAMTFVSRERMSSTK
jgi:hypothetical protein